MATQGVNKDSVLKSKADFHGEMKRLMAREGVVLGLGNDVLPFSERASRPSADPAKKIFSWRQGASPSPFSSEGALSARRTVFHEMSRRSAGRLQGLRAPSAAVFAALRAHEARSGAPPPALASPISPHFSASYGQRGLPARSVVLGLFAPFIVGS